MYRIDPEQIQRYGWHTLQDRPLTREEARDMARKIVGDSPEHAQHLIWDSHTDTYAESNGGLAFSVGVAVIECVTVCDPDRFWRVCHKNGVELYVVQWNSTYGTVCVTKVY